MTMNNSPKKKRRPFVRRRVLFLFAALVVVIAVLWTLWGEDFLADRQLFRRFGFELPPRAEQVSVNNAEDALVIEFRLPPAEAARLIAQPLPGYSAWRKQGKHEVLESIGGVPDPEKRDFVIGEKRAGPSLWRVLVEPATGKCIAFYVRDSTT